MSMFTAPTRLLAGTVGLRAKYSEPSRPFSSAVTARNRIDRRGRVCDVAAARAVSSSAAMPAALSSAPLYRRSPLTSAPMPS